MTVSRPAAVVILAAGAGTRMKSQLPKVLHPICGASMLDHVLAAARELSPAELIVVVGHGRRQVAAHLARHAPDVRVVVQQRQGGTGHAVRTVTETVGLGQGTVVVTYGDTPLLRGSTLAALVREHAAEQATATALTTFLTDPTGYGRILRDARGAFAGIVEESDATLEQRAVTEINSGVYAFESGPLADAVKRLPTDNAKGEEYLTDVAAILRAEGHHVATVTIHDGDEVRGVNDRVQLAHARRILNARILDRWMRAGVTIVDPLTTLIDAGVILEPDAEIGPGTQLAGSTVVGAGAHVGPGCVLTRHRRWQGCRAHARGRRVRERRRWRHRGPLHLPGAGYRTARWQARAAAERRWQARKKGSTGVTGITVKARKKLMLFSGRAHPELGQEIGACLGIEPTPTRLSDFANGEIFVRFLESVRGCDAFVLQSHTAPINRWIMEQLIMVDALKRASAKRITVVTPFFGYARQDKKSHGREPISARLMADLFAAAGADRMMAVDLHTAQIQGFFDGPVDHLFALPILASYIEGRVDISQVTVVAPDAGRVRVCERWTDRLGSPLAIIHKRRDPDVAHRVAVLEVVGDVAGRTCIVVDDMIDTGSTITKAAEALFAQGAAQVIVAATHGVLSAAAVDELKNSRISEVIVTSTLPIPPEKHFDKLTVLSIAPLIGRAIQEVFSDGSVTSLFEGRT